MKLLLIAPPWQLFNRPSIQLGALKAFLLQEEPGLEVRALHPYLSFAHELGFTDYHSISQSSWASESVGAALLHPENFNHCQDIFARALCERGSGMDSSRAPTLFYEAVERLDGFVDGFVSGLCETESGKGGYAEGKGLLLGLSACLNQFAASLLFAKRIKERLPGATLVLGGTSCSGTVAPSIMECYPFVDYVVSGEGELPLLALCRMHSGKDVILPDAVLSRNGKGSARHEEREGDEAAGRSHLSMCQVDSLNELSTPDFDDYFRELGTLPASARFHPVLPVEASRGCWWGRCNFCNLNLQWRGYRARSSSNVASSIDQLSRRYRCIDFAFMDNVLPRRGASALFEELAAHGRDYSFFAELRAVHSREEYGHMARGGLRTLQVGIEALSSAQLERLGKGARVIDNIAAMRHAFEAGVELDGNLIVHFPGTTQEEIDETLKILDFVWPYRPLKTVSYWLGHGSPAEDMSRRMGIRRMAPHPWWRRMFSSREGSMPRSLILWYAGDREKQKKMWRPVEQKVRRWQSERQKAGMDRVLLSYRDGGDFLSITQCLSTGAKRTHRLNGLSREIYLFCTEIRTVEAIMKFAGTRISLEQLGSFVQSMVNLRLMFSDGTRVLSLAVRERRGS